MPPALAYAPAPEVDLLAAFTAQLSRLGLTGVNLSARRRRRSCAAGPIRSSGRTNRCRCGWRRRGQACRS